jgi:hypothetical protein
MRLPLITMASLRTGGSPDPSIKVPLRMTTVFSELIDPSRAQSY